MASDLKFGLVVGLGLVLLVAVTYHSKEGTPNGKGAANVVPSLPAASTPAR